MLGVPIGVAFGYSFSTLIANASNWTFCFYTEAIFGLFFACLFIFTPLSTLKKKEKLKVDALESDLERHNQDLEIDESEDHEISITKVESISQMPNQNDYRSDEDQNSEFSLLERVDEDSYDVTSHEPHVEEELKIHSDEPKSVFMPQKKDNPYQIFSFFSACKYLFCNPIYCFATLGSCGYNFVAGAIQFYAPSYVLHKMKQNETTLTSAAELSSLANVGFSMVMLIASIIGTILGGFILDRFGGSNGMKGASRGLLFCGIFLIVGFPWVLPCFLWDVNIYSLLLLFGTSCCFLFCSTSPFQCSVVNSVEHKNLRNYGVSWQILLFHLLGDFPSPFIFGLIQDSFSIDAAMGSIWLMLVPSSIVFLIGYVVSQNWIKRRHEDMVNQFTNPKPVVTEENLNESDNEDSD